MNEKYLRIDRSVKFHFAYFQGSKQMGAGKKRCSKSLARQIGLTLSGPAVRQAPPHPGLVAIDGLGCPLFLALHRLPRRRLAA